MNRLVMCGFIVAVGCGAPPAAKSPLAPSRDDAILTIISTPALADAEVWLDDANVGSIASVHRGLAIAAGHHRIELRADGYFSAFREVDLLARAHATVEIALVPSLP